MKRVLIITYWYPPKNVIGAIRLAKFAKYLPKYGWEPIVVTVDPRTDLYTSSGELKDELTQGRVYRTRDWSFGEIFTALYRKLRGSNKSSRAPTSSSASRESALAKFYRSVICYPDECILWRFLSLGEIGKILEREKPDLIFSSSLPNTAHLIASKLSQRFKVPWVADFRDLWTQNPYLDRANWLKSKEERLERRVLSQASAMVTISDGLKSELAERYDKPIFAIPNGFDPDDLAFDAHDADGNVDINGSCDKLTLTFTGTIYPGKRDPSPLFDAMLLLKADGKINDEILVKFYGRKQDFIAQLLEDKYSDLKHSVELCGAIPRDEALRAQSNSAALLLLEWIDPRARGVYTGKIFEYLAANKPILSIGPDGGVLEQLIEKTNSGFQATDPQVIADKLGAWLEEYRASGRLEHNPDYDEIAKYSREKQTEMLAAVFDGVVGLRERDNE